MRQHQPVCLSKYWLIHSVSRLAIQGTDRSRRYLSTSKACVLGGGALRLFELRNLMIGSVVFTLTFIIGWLLGIGQVPLTPQKPTPTQSALLPDTPLRP